MSDIARFMEARPRLLGVAYRILGSAADAEEVVQDAFLRWQREPRNDVTSAEAFLVRTVSRLALDRLALARTQREVYIGPWLPEPIGASWPDTGADPDTISLAFLVLLETLTPLERAVFVLHEVFEYNHQEIGSFLDRTEGACRQLLRRAKEHIRAGRPRIQTSEAEHERLLKAFVAACKSGEIDKLRELLAEDVTLWSDGGGRAPAAITPVIGRATLAKYLLAQMRRKMALSISLERINGKLAIVSRRPSGAVEDVLDLVSSCGLITAIYAVRNPEKLQKV